MEKKRDNKQPEFFLLCTFYFHKIQYLLQMRRKDEVISMCCVNALQDRCINKQPYRTKKKQLDMALSRINLWFDCSILFRK